MKRLFYILNIIFLILFFMSCKDEMDEADGVRPSRNDSLGIGFCTSGDGFEKPETRGGIGSVKDLPHVCVLAMKEKGKGWESVFFDDGGNAIDYVTLLNNNKEHQVDGEIWEYSPKAKWKSDYNYKFRAFYPKSLTATTSTHRSGNNGLEVDIPTNDVTKQSCDNGRFIFTSGSTQLALKNYSSHKIPSSNIDLMYSQTIERCNNTEVVALNMKHMLARVNFKFNVNDNRKVVITKFSVNGYVANGDCVIDEEPHWTVDYEDDGTEPLIISWYKKDNGKEVLYQRYVFRDNSTGEELDFNAMQKRIQTVSDADKYSYTIYPGSPSLGTKTFDGSKTAGVYDGFTNLLFIPQKLKRGDARFDIIYNLYRYDKSTVRNEFGDGGIRVNSVLVKRNVFADMEFYIDNDSEHPIKATIDLSAGGQVDKWDAGKIYTYTIGINIMSVNVEIEDWQPHKIIENVQ